MQMTRRELLAVARRRKRLKEKQLFESTNKLIGEIDNRLARMHADLECCLRRLGEDLGIVPHRRRRHGCTGEKSGTCTASAERRS